LDRAPVSPTLIVYGANLPESPAACPGPPWLFTGGILEQLSVFPLWVSASPRSKKALPLRFRLPHSFRGKCEKSDFNFPPSHPRLSYRLTDTLIANPNEPEPKRIHHEDHQGSPRIKTKRHLQVANGPLFDFKPLFRSLFPHSFLLSILRNESPIHHSSLILLLSQSFLRRSAERIPYIFLPPFPS
jgi:hypothetical protein